MADIAPEGLPATETDHQLNRNGLTMIIVNPFRFN
jgi:hypothetical protein